MSRACRASAHHGGRVVAANRQARRVTGPEVTKYRASSPSRRPSSSRIGSSFNALFCTAPIPASMVNGLLKHAKDAADVGNIFCLIKSPSYDHAANLKPVAPPVSEFESGFQGWSIERLGEWCREQSNRNDPKKQPPYIADEEFAVLDDRTLQDGTVLLVTHDIWHERIDPDDPSDADEAFRRRAGYRELRAVMKEATFHGVSPRA